VDRKGKWSDKVPVEGCVVVKDLAGVLPVARGLWQGQPPAWFKCVANLAGVLLVAAKEYDILILMHVCWLALLFYVTLVFGYNLLLGSVRRLCTRMVWLRRISLPLLTEDFDPAGALCALRLRSCSSVVLLSRVKAVLYRCFVLQSLDRHNGCNHLTGITAAIIWQA
jgi:hypothetical protein